MQKEIETALTKIEIEAKQKRRRTERNILLVVMFALLFFIIPYYYEPFRILYVLDVFWIAVGGFYVFYSQLPTLAQPLRREYYAFKKIAKAIDFLEKLKEPIAYEEAYHEVEGAYNALSQIGLDDSIAWYKPTNETFGKFLKNMEKIVLPATKASIIKEDHLVEVALAVYSLDIAKINTVNTTLDAEPSYKKSTVEEGVGEGIGYRTRRLFAHYTVFVISSFIVGCAVFGYVSVAYMGIQKEYVYAASVAACLTLIGLYLERRRPKEV